MFGRELTEDECCKLMAWMSIYGCINECVAEIYPLLKYAQEKLNIIGGQNLMMEYIIKINEYNKSIIDIENPPEWLLELEKLIGLKKVRRR